MKQIKKHIYRKKLEFATLPLFAYLRDVSICPRQRLAITPYLAHFTMIFGDLDKYVGKDLDRRENLFQRLLQAHAHEKDHPFSWFLREFESIGLDRRPPLSEALRFLWGEHTSETRRLSYELAARLRYADPLDRYIVLEALKAHGNVIFANALKAASDLRNTSEHDSIFDGEFHLALDNEPRCGAAGRAQEEAMSQRELREDELARGAALVDKVHAIFRTYILELHRYALRYPALESRSAAVA